MPHNDADLAPPQVRHPTLAPIAAQILLARDRLESELRSARSHALWQAALPFLMALVILAPIFSDAYGDWVAALSPQWGSFMVGVPLLLLSLGLLSGALLRLERYTTEAAQRVMEALAPRIEVTNAGQLDDLLRAFERAHLLPLGTETAIEYRLPLHRSGRPVEIASLRYQPVDESSIRQVWLMRANLHDAAFEPGLDLRSRYSTEWSAPPDMPLSCSVSGDRPFERRYRCRSSARHGPPPPAPLRAALLALRAGRRRVGVRLTGNVLLLAQKRGKHSFRTLPLFGAPLPAKAIERLVGDWARLLDVVAACERAPPRRASPAARR